MTQTQPQGTTPTLEGEVPDILPTLPSDGAVMFPYLMVPLVATRASDISVLEEAAGSPTKMLAVFSQRPTEDGRYEGEMYEVGTAAIVTRFSRLPTGQVQATLQGAMRVRRLAIEQREPVLRVRVEPVEEVAGDPTETEALTRTALSLFERIVSETEGAPRDLAITAAAIQLPGALADFIASNIPISSEERQHILESLNVVERLRQVIGHLNHEVEVLEVRSRIQSQMQQEMDKRQREYILREQLRAIQKELGESAESPEIADLRQRIEEAHLPEAARKEAERELERLGAIPPQSPEYQVARTHLEWLADLPWDKSTEDNLDIDRAEAILNEDHYGLTKVKQRILDYLAVRKLRADTRGPILCFVGPPGTGKTSLGQSIARALGRHFVRMSLGGVRDEAEIRGHRRTYIGSLPGRIIQEIRRAGVNNPLIMLDEVDKLGADFRGDPSSALLEVLDPAQNHSFVDHYLDVPFDLSRVLFITTANLLDPIPAPLRDRMEIIELHGYTENEKLAIAKGYLLPRQIRENGLTPDLVEVTDEAILEVIRSYTREAGVRNLERELGAICRGVARRVARGEQEKTVVTVDQLPEYLGRARFRWELAAETDEIGVATGLAVTPVGGDVLFVEAASVPGKGQLTLTGQLGNVMQESARAALTYARMRAAQLGIDDNFLEKHDIHIHVPAGAIPKDGPSAGVTMATALVSAITRRPVRREVAMTGEITLRGRVLPIGGVRDKVLAAHRSGVKTVILPKDNERDLQEVEEDIRRDLNIVLAEHVDDVLNIALHPQPQEEESRLITISRAS